MTHLFSIQKHQLAGPITVYPDGTLGANPRTQTVDRPVTFWAPDRILRPADLPRLTEPDTWAVPALMEGAVRRYRARARVDASEGGWQGCTPAEARERLAGGWAEGAETVARLARQVASRLHEPRSIRRRMRWQDDGNTLGLDQALRGEWDRAWRGPHREVVNAPQTIHVACSLSASGSESADSMGWRGAAMLALADALEAAGWQTRLTAVCGAYDGYAKTAQTLSTGLAVRLKEAGDPLNVAGLTGAVAHAGTFRYFGILNAHFCDAPRASEAMTSTMSGHPQPPETTVALLAAAGLLDPVDVVVPFCNDEETAARALDAVVDRVNAVAEGVAV